MAELKTFIEKKAEQAESLSICKNLKLKKVKDTVAQMLSLIQRDGLFDEYTIHDISHVDNMLGIIDWLIPEITKQKMTLAECLMLTLAVYFHDVGMLVSKKEFETRSASDFENYKNNIKKNKVSEYTEFALNNEKFMYQEFVREHHAERIKAWIEGNAKKDFGNAGDQVDIINETLSSLDKKFRADLAMICESHHLDDIDNFDKYRLNSYYGATKDESVNLNYVAIILRCADLLHITNDRTPSIARKIINVSNPQSIIEWEKQKAVKAVVPKKNRNEEGNIDDSIEMDSIEVHAYFDGAETAEAYFGLSAYLQYTQKELAKCNAIVTKAQKTEGAKDYLFPWKKIDDTKIEVVGFETKKLQFVLAQENILNLLVGHTLYNDSSVVVREIAQNGIDAVKLQNIVEKIKGKELTKGKVIVDWNEDKRILSFTDNGTGMTFSDIEKYLLTVGASKYRDESFKKQFPDFNSISRFGIGILTCFMVANDVDITTCSEEEQLANLINLRNVNGNYLLKKIEKDKLEDDIKKHGTKVELHVRNDIKMNNVETNLKKWIVVPNVPVYFSVNGGECKRIDYDNLKDVLKEYFDNSDESDKNYEIVEFNQGDVSVACALRYNEFFSDKDLIKIGRRERTLNNNIPIGTCVEGIRVEFNTPGFKNGNIFAIANIKNSKFKTNVARSALEFDADNQVLKDIYLCYKNYLQEQMDNMEKNNFSLSWALSENSYLIQPLLDSRYSGYISEPLDKNILLQSLSELKCIMLENDGKREAVSVAAIADMDEINIFECKIRLAIESMFKEIKTEATLNKILDVVCKEDNFIKDAKNVICNYSQANILHRYALRSKHVNRISVNKKQRRICLTLANDCDIWEKYVIIQEDEKCLFIPKDEFEIEGLGDEIGVDTDLGIFLKSDSEFCKYIKKIINDLLNVGIGRDNFMLINFLSSLFKSKILETTYDKDMDVDVISLFGEYSSSLRRNNGKKIFDHINMEEFKNQILTKKNVLFSISNWSRNVDIEEN